MNIAVLVALGLDLVLIGLLPQVFFKKGSANLRWCLTAAPFFMAGCLVAWALVGTVWSEVPLPSVEVWSPAARLVADGAAMVLVLGSVALMTWTVGIHHVPLSLWHQDDDAPAAIITRGPYAYVRHPFYVSFLLGLGALMLAIPHVATALLFAYAAVGLTLTARREEKKLASSAFGDEYRAYLVRVGRFWPRLMNLASVVRGRA